MTAPPPHADRIALNRNRARAGAQGLFLHDEAVFQVQERLRDVNRTFTSPAIVAGFPGRWREVIPGARVVADDATIALRPAAHDLVVHALALHWADDPIGQLVQCRRALRPDGLFIGVTPGGRTLSALRDALARAEVAVSGGMSPRVAPMAEIRDLGSLLQRAGFALPVADSVTVTARYPDLWAMMRDVRAMGEANALALRNRRIPPRALFAHAAAHYPADADGRLSATFELVFLTGWAPAPDQQKPLRPGSAAARLADALAATQPPAGDAASVAAGPAPQGHRR